MKISAPIIITGTIDKIIKLKEDYPSHSDLYNSKIVFNFNRTKEALQEDTKAEAIKNN